MTNKIQEMGQKLAELKAQQEMEEIASSSLLQEENTVVEENTTEEEFSIEALLTKQTESVKDDLFKEIVAIAEYNDKRFAEIYGIIKSKTENKEVWNDYSFGSVSGRILGILRTLNFSFKQKESLCAELGLPSVLMDIYYRDAGNAPYYDSKENEIVNARPMNIPVTKQLVKRVATALKIIVSDFDLNMITADAEKARNAKALKDAKATLANGGFKANVKEESTFTQNVNITVQQNKQEKISKHLEGVLDA